MMTLFKGGSLDDSPKRGAVGIRERNGPVSVDRVLVVDNPVHPGFSNCSFYEEIAVRLFVNYPCGR